MANKLHSFDKAMQSSWNERGGTYQEAVLARRKLYFTPAEVWFECVEGMQRENAFSEDWRSATLLGNPLKVSNETRSASDEFEEYGRHVERYSKRILTYPSDVYHALNGIEAALYHDRGTFFGLPEPDFNRALLWYPYNWPGLKERECDDPDLVLPSWSWASLTGHVHFSSIYGKSSRRSPIRQRGSFYCSLVRWARWDVTVEKGLRQIDNSNEGKVWNQLDDIGSEAKSTNALHPDFDSFDGEPDYRQFLAAAWSLGCVEADIPHDLQAMSATDLQSRWPTLADFWAKVRSRASSLQGISSVAERSIDGISAGVLFARAQWSVLRVEHDGHNEHLRGDIYVPNANFVIRDGSGKVIGALLGTVEYRLRGETAAEGVVDVDFLALSVGPIPECLTRNMNSETLEKNHCLAGQNGSPLRCNQPGIAVMAVRWDASESQAAHRIAIGWITLQGWADSKTRFREVYLR